MYTMMTRGMHSTTCQSRRWSIPSNIVFCTHAVIWLLFLTSGLIATSESVPVPAKRALATISAASVSRTNGVSPVSADNDVQIPDRAASTSRSTPASPVANGKSNTLRNFSESDDIDEGGYVSPLVPLTVYLEDGETLQSSDELGACPERYNDVCLPSRCGQSVVKMNDDDTLCMRYISDSNGLNSCMTFVHCNICASKEVPDGVQDCDQLDVRLYYDGLELSKEVAAVVPGGRAAANNKPVCGNNTGPLQIAEAKFSNGDLNENCASANCIDGSLSDNHCNKGTSLCSSKFGNDIHLMLDLGASQIVNTAVIHNRQHCCQDQVGYHQIWISDSPDLDETTATLCYEGIAKKNALYIIDKCTEPTAGRYLFFKLPGNNRIIWIREISLYDENGFYGIGKGGFGLWTADDITKLTDKAQWGGFNNFFDDADYLAKDVSPEGMTAACPECSSKWMVEEFQDCYPQYETYEQYGCFTYCKPFLNKTTFTPKDFNYYLLLERRESPLKAYFEQENINGNSGFFSENNGFITYKEFVDAGESFDTNADGDDKQDRTTVETVQMAKHCHVTFRDDTLWYITETQHNVGRKYYDLSFAAGESGHTAYNDHLTLLDADEAPDYAGSEVTAGPILDYCDCTRAAPNANGCGSEECFALGARTGVMCNNCGGRCNECWENGYCTHTMWYSQEQFAEGTVPSNAFLEQAQCALCLWQGAGRLEDEYFGSIFAYPDSPLYPY